MLQSTPLKEFRPRNSNFSIPHQGRLFMSASETTLRLFFGFTHSIPWNKTFLFLRLVAKGYSHILKSSSAAYSDSTSYYYYTSSIPNGISSSSNWFRGSVSGLVLLLAYPNSLSRIVVLFSGHHHA
ncbi:hypothetical protein QL285_075480 [Trifolium repens]|nr:hypothetical protein QL285_075480 [Trifolium repens]